MKMAKKRNRNSIWNERITLNFRFVNYLNHKTKRSFCHIIFSLSIIYLGIQADLTERQFNISKITDKGTEREERKNICPSKEFLVVIFDRGTLTETIFANPEYQNKKTECTVAILSSKKIDDFTKVNCELKAVIHLHITK
jgi:hypothetical protein